MEINNAVRRVPAPPRCGIVLAAGDGKRLQPFVKRVCRDSLPKQYVNFFGNHSMLQHAYARAERIILRERLFTVVSQAHLAFAEVRHQLSERPRDTLVIQPENKETGPGLLLPLIHLSKRYPESTVAIFPTDHFIMEETLFMDHVEMAFRLVEQDSSRIVMLGVEPSGPDPEYGYILPGQSPDGAYRARARQILRFVEKPRQRLAQVLLRRAALWNTMVMVFNAADFLRKVRRIAPVIYAAFEKIGAAMGTARCDTVLRKTYAQMEPMNFSTGLLEVIGAEEPSPLLVLPVRGVRWSDCGSEHRILRVLRENGDFGRLRASSEC